MKESFIYMCKQIARNSKEYSYFNCIICDLEEARLLNKAMIPNTHINNCHIEPSENFIEEELAECEDIVDSIVIKVLENRANASLHGLSIFHHVHKDRAGYSLRESTACDDLTAMVYK
jgi:hypothetical protein